MNIDITGSKSRKRTRAMADIDSVPSNPNKFQFKQQPMKRHKKTEYCYVVQTRQTKHGNNNQHTWDVINSFQNVHEANQCMIQTLREMFKVKSEYDINSSRFRKIVDVTSLIRFHDIIPPNSNGISVDIWAEKHEIETIIGNER